MDFPSPGHRHRVRRFATGLLALVMLGGALAQSPDGDDARPGLRELHHSSWSVREGAPVDIWAIAQAANGELWLGTGAGLHRFDGMRFLAHPMPEGHRLASTNITALEITGADEMWIGYHAAGISHLAVAGIRHFGHAQGVPRGMVFRIEQDDAGIAWAAIEEGLARFDGTTWRKVGADWGYAGRHADWVFLDREGRLWVADGETVLQLPRGATRFVPTGVETVRHAVIAQDPQGRIWVSDSRHGTRVIDAAGAGPGPVAAVPLDAKRLLFTGDGALWATDTRLGGVVRVAADGRAMERLGRDQGLTADMAVPLLQDREGSVWVGTNLGLNRFRPNHVRAVAGLRDTTRAHFAMFVPTDGAARIVNDGRLYRADRAAMDVPAEGMPLVIAATTGRDGQAWLLGSDSLWPWTSAGLGAAVEFPEGQGARQVAAMAPDAAGGFWAVLSGAGVFHRGQAGWQRLAAAGETPPQVLAADAGGGVWLGFGDGRAALASNGRSSWFGAAQGLDVGGITAIRVDGDSVLFAGEQGLALRRGGRLRSLVMAQADGLTGVTGIERSTSGEWWLNGSAGLARIADGELQRALEDPAYLPVLRVFDQQDGMPGVALQARPMPTLAMDGHGVLWIATNQGMAWLDPARVRKNRVIPPVWIHSLAAADQTHAAATPVSLPAGTTQVRIDYSAGSLAVPERVRFRYRLEGADDAWQDAGARRQAFYTNLGPGDYRFQVLAANNDGVWNDQGATLEFTIEPTFVQGHGFIAACAVAALLLLWMLHLLRVRTASMRLRDRLETRHQEREHIARDLHDTLLQGFQGLLLRFQSVADELPPATPARQRLDQALDRAQSALEEGRDRVSGLRGQALSDESLSEVLLAVGRDYAASGAVRFQVVVEGDEAALDCALRDELCLIGREALVNAFRHSGASEVTVRLRHDADGLLLQVQDDGRGIAPEILAAGSRHRHWGLAGMQERAARIGARLELGSPPGGGTCIRLQVPAHSLQAARPRAGLRERLARFWNQGA